MQQSLSQHVQPLMEGKRQLIALHTIYAVLKYRIGIAESGMCDSSVIKRTTSCHDNTWHQQPQQTIVQQVHHIVNGISQQLHGQPVSNVSTWTT